MAIKLTSTDMISPFANILVFGEAGIGKTTLCKTAENPLIISAEGGLLSLKNDNIPAFEISNREDCNEIHKWLSSSREADKYDTICIDSLSEIAEVLLSDEKTRMRDTSSTGKIDPRQAYGVMSDEMQILTRAFRDLPKHVYFSCKLKKLTDENSGRISYIPSVPGQVFLQALPYLFDEVLALRLGKLDTGTYRYLMTEKDGQWDVKDRSGELEAQEEPNLAKIIAKVIKKAGQKSTKEEK